MIEKFENYLTKEGAKRAQPNLALARSLIKDMNSRIKDISFLELNKFPKIIFEQVYDALRDFADALLAIDGFKAYSHEASFSYLEKYNFDNISLFLLDKFRYRRNGSKYYGQIILVDEAKEILEFYKKNKDKIKEIIKKKNILL